MRQMWGQVGATGEWAEAQKRPTPGSRLLFSYENLVSTAREFSRKCETLRCENSTPAIISLNYEMSMHNPLLLINGIDVAFSWAWLEKRSKEISCSRIS